MAKRKRAQGGGAASRSAQDKDKGKDKVEEDHQEEEEKQEEEPNRNARAKDKGKGKAKADEDPNINAQAKAKDKGKGKGKGKGKAKVDEDHQEEEEKQEEDPSRKARRKDKGKAKVGESHEEDGDKQEEEEDKQEEKKEEGKQRGKVGKRRRVTSRRDDEPEYFEEKRNLEDLWKEVFPVGTEWDQFHLVYQYNWNFTNLEGAFEEGGVLHGKKVYLFGCTEPQMVPLNNEMKITHVPVVVAVVSPFPPSDKIGINSVQREAEEIVPMKQMKMDWVPYIPLEKRGRMVERLKPSEIFILRCTQRRSALMHLTEARVKKFEYCLPYFYNPLQEDELEQSTTVQILYPIEPKPVFCEFDWEFDEVEEFTDKLIEEEELSADQKEEFQNFLKEKVREARKANREAREARKKAREDMSAEKRAAIENIRFYKFYPVATPDTPDVSGVKAPFINRYYGKAHEVF